LKDVQSVVEQNDKQRFSMQKGGDGEWQIRANQGHTIKVSHGMCNTIRGVTGPGHLLKGEDTEAFSSLLWS
jgi:RNA:NAD 2'-phosphotransferase (TPT1/KptA family)